MDADLRAELLHRMERDQAARLAYDAEAAFRADAENLPWLCVGATFAASLSRRRPPVTVAAPPAPQAAAAAGTEE